MFSDEPQAEQFYAGDYSGMKHSAAPPVYWCPQTCHEAFSPMKGDHASYDFTEANALTNYHLGLTAEVSPQGKYIPFDMAIADEQRVYEEYTHGQYEFSR